MASHLVTVAIGSDAATPFGIETGIRYELIGPDGTRVTFNDDTDRDFVGYVEEITGLDGAEVRESYEQLVEEDGARHFAFYHGRRPVTITGPLNPNVFGTAANRNITRLLRASNAMTADAVLRWTPTGGVPVEISARRTSPPRVSGQRVKTYQVGLTAADPRIYATTPLVATQPLSSGSASLVCANAGSASTSPLVTISGPFTNPTLTKGSLSMSLTSTMVAGQSVTIDFANRTIVNQAGASIYSVLNYTTSQWFDLAPGSSTIVATVTGATAATIINASWRSAWI